ncbi:MAG: ABC transporter substrate-binding protein [Tissierellia bacterium]|nr:ABC transporter substrate-binding protein [Tissierellia bacterium]
MKKKILSLLLVGLLVFSFTACGQTETSNEITTDGKTETATNEGGEKNIDGMTFNEMLEAAKGTKVSFYGWGGNEKLNKWLDEVYAKSLKEKYDITLDRVPMDIDQILSQLSGEVQAGVDGPIDMIWINGENFKSCKENNMLYGPFTERLPNFEKYIDPESDDIKLDFGYPVEGYEAPYSKAQVVFVVDGAKVSERPKNAAEFLEFAKKYKGKVAYPALPDFTGSVFVRNIINETCDYSKLMNPDLTKEEVREIIKPAIDYLVELNPYLWGEGKTFPVSGPDKMNMFSDGELVFDFTYESYGPVQSIADGTYPETVETFIFDKGTIGNTNFIAIAKNSTNKAGAMVAINEMLTPKMQASKLQELKLLPVLDNDKLSDEEKKLFELDLGKAAIPQDELLSKRLPELPAGLVPIIEEIWAEDVVGK